MRGAGRGRGRSSVETGFCSVHMKRRSRADLVPMRGNPGSMQCRHGKECHGRERERDQGGMGMCSVHHRRRNLAQLRQVRPGVWQCVPDSQCRAQGDAPARSPSGGPRDRVARGRGRTTAGRGRGGSAGGGRGGGKRTSGRGGQGFTPLRSFSGGSNKRGQQRRGSDRGADDPGTQWNPQSTVHSMLGANAAQSRLQRQAASRREGRAAWTLMKVWCARHGKQLSLLDTDKFEECCYVCTDPTECVSSPLPAPSELRKSGCKEVLCARHDTLRSVGFVEVNKDKTGYQCLTAHPCRHVARTKLAAMSAEAAAAAAGTGVAVEGFGDPADGYYQVGGGASGGGANASATRNYAQPNAAEAVSSFFA